MSSTRPSPRKQLLRHAASVDLDTVSQPMVYEILLQVFSSGHAENYTVACALSSRYPTLPALLDASREDLRSYSGLNEDQANLLIFLGNLCRFYMHTKEQSVFATVQDRAHILTYATKKLIESFRGETTEALRASLFAADGKFLGMVNLSHGTTHRTYLPLRKLIEEAFRYKAASILLAHNHPDGSCASSTEDEEATVRVSSFLRQVDIELLDHLVTNGFHFVSILHPSEGNFQQEICNIHSTIAPDILNAEVPVDLADPLKTSFISDISEDFPLSDDTDLLETKMENENLSTDDQSFALFYLDHGWDIDPDEGIHFFSEG